MIGKGEYMKKLISGLIFVGMIFAAMLMAVACGSEGTKKEITDSEDNTKDNVNEDTDKDRDSENNDEDTSNTDTDKRALETIDETVLFEQDGVKVTATEIVNDPIWGKGIKVLIENNSNKNVAVQCNTIVVNNYMINDLFSSEVAAGKKSNETITLLTTNIDEAGINTIAEINISFHVIDSESYDTLFDTEEVTIKTSAYGTVEQPALDSGKELLNTDGIRIVGKYVTEGSIWGAGVLLFMENNSDEDIIIQCDNMSINGFMVTPYFSCQVNKGRMALDTITILDSDLEDNGIDEVKDLELEFNILNPKTYQTIYQSEPIPFSVD